MFKSITIRSIHFLVVNITYVLGSVVIEAYSGDVCQFLHIEAYPL